MGRELLRVERDANGQALDDLDPVARRVLRRDDGERRSRAAAQAHDRAVEHDGRAVEIRCERHGFADAHARELALLEVRIHIGLRHRHHAHDGRARRHMLADLRRVLRHDAVDRRADDRALEVELRLVERRLGGEHFGIVRGIGAGNQRALRGQLIDRLREAGLRGLQIVARGRQFVAGHGARRGQRGAAPEIHFGAGEIAAARADLGRGGIDIGEILRDMLLRLGEIRLRLRDRDLRIRGIDGCEDVAPFHMLRVVGRNARQRAFDARRNLRGRRIDIGVVGGRVMRAHEKPVCADGKRDNDDKAAQDREQSLAQPRAALGRGQFGRRDAVDVIAGLRHCGVLQNMRASHHSLHCRFARLNS